MGEEMRGVAKNSKILLICGAVLVAISLFMRVYIAGAEKEAERLGDSNFLMINALLGNERFSPNLQDLQKQADELPGKPILVTSNPPGAAVPSEALFSAGLVSRAKAEKTETGKVPYIIYTAPLSTPTLINRSETPISLTTTFHEGLLSNPKVPAQLSLKTKYLILINLIWPGLIMVFTSLFLIRKSKPELEQAPSTSRTFLSSPPHAPGESGSTTRVVAPPQPPQVSQIFSLVEGPFQHDPATPEQLIYGRFVQGEMIGQGGMGTVYRCQSCVPGDQGRYALKVLLPEWSKSPDFRARFEREADICHKLTHRNLVRAYERGEKDGDLWMVMDFVQGSELNQWLQKKKRSPEEIIELFVQICEGLSHAHKQDIVHRDLKPENILVTEDGRKAVIADFGLAKGKHYATITKTNTTLGTPIYMPPEQITGGSGGPLGDLYSLGCILYESLSGSIPFPETDVLALLNSKLTGKSPPELRPEQAGPELRKIVEKLMAYKPDDRFQSAEELKESLILLSRESSSSGS